MFVPPLARASYQLLPFSHFFILDTVPCSPHVSGSSLLQALRYAKNVPRPPLRTPQEVLHGRLYGPARDDFGGRDGARTYVVDEIAKLDELAERHRQEKEEIERLRNGEPPRK